MDETDEKILERLIRDLWLKTKPSFEAQQIRAEVSCMFDDPHFETWASDELPGYVWDLIDVAVQQGLDKCDDVLRELAEAKNEINRLWACLEALTKTQ